MLTGLKRVSVCLSRCACLGLSVRLSRSGRTHGRAHAKMSIVCLRLFVCLGLGLSRPVHLGLSWSVCLFRSVCLGLSISVCLALSVSVCLSRSVYLGLSCFVCLGLSVSVSVCLSRSRSVCLFLFCLSRSVSVCRSRSVCLGLSVSVCLSVLVRLSRSVSLCLGRAGRTDEHINDVNNAVSRAAHASAMSIMRCQPANITGIANVWSSLYPCSKTLQNKAFPGQKAPPKLTLKI